MTIAGLRKYYMEKYKISLSIITVGKTCIFNKYVG